MHGGVLLINMPFSSADRPQLNIGLLKSAVLTRNIPCETADFNLTMAEAVRPDVYQWFSELFNHNVFAGEWVFAHHFFGDFLIDGEGYLRYLREKAHVSPEEIAKILWVRRHVGDFLDHCLRSVDWSRYSIIGFTSTFHQNMPSLALAHAIKQRYPDKIVVMGGANCEDPMGLALHRCFPFLDYVFSGEADYSFPEFVERIAARRPVTDVRGLVYRDGKKSVFTGSAKLITDMDALPYPNFDSYFTKLSQTSVASFVNPMMLMETSRGCWWGAKHHCTFCGLNDETLVYRSKSQERALEEILYLVKRYPARNIGAVDDIMDWKYFRQLLPELKRLKLNVSFFYEEKANMTREQVQLLSEAGIRGIQPGVESMSRKILALMRKGTTPLQNVELLKWCKQFGVRAAWNLIYGFPGETAEDYAEMLPLLKSLTHLGPPEGEGNVMLHRYSPYFVSPESFGMKNARPLEVYKYIYPFAESDLRDLVYHYQFEYADGLDPTSYMGPVLQQLQAWREAQRGGASLESYATAPDATLILDTRPNAVRQRTVLKGWRKELYDFCEVARSMRSIERWLKENAPEVLLCEVQEWLQRLVKLRLMVAEGDQYLSLAIPAASNGQGWGSMQFAPREFNPTAASRQATPA